MQKKTLTPILLAGIFFLMLGLSFAAVPLYDIFCRVTGFGGTTQISKEAPLIVLDQKVSVRFDTNVNKLPWNFKVKKNVLDVKIGQVNRIEFEVENYGNETTYGVAAFNVSPSSFGKYYSKLGCFCFEKQALKAGEKATYIMTFYLDPEMVNDPNTKNIKDVTMSYTFFFHQITITNQNYKNVSRKKTRLSFSRPKSLAYIRLIFMLSFSNRFSLLSTQ
jgi:cytochrome c oxidase assembly protein subunit 11